MQKIFQKMLNLAFEIYAVIIYIFLHFLFHSYCNVPCLLGTTSIYEKLFPSLLHILRSSLGIVFLCFVSSSRVRINRSNQPCKKISHFWKIRKIMLRSNLIDPGSKINSWQLPNEHIKNYIENEQGPESKLETTMSPTKKSSHIPRT